MNSIDGNSFYNQQNVVNQIRSMEDKDLINILNYVKITRARVCEYPRNFLSYP